VDGTFPFSFAFVNLVVFRIVLGQGAPRGAWAAATLGILGVALLTANEIVETSVNADALLGSMMAFAAVVAAALGNLSARRGAQARAPLQSSLAWSMGYGALLLAVFAMITGRRWTFDFRPAYMLSLLYLAVAASVLAFMLYFGLARRRGYTIASYVLAWTPLLAVTMSALFEGKAWSRLSVMGIALVLGGQWLLLRAQTMIAEQEDSATQSVVHSAL